MDCGHKPLDEILLHLCASYAAVVTCAKRPNLIEQYMAWNGVVVRLCPMENFVREFTSVCPWDGTWHGIIFIVSPRRVNGVVVGAHEEIIQHKVGCISIMDILI